MMYVQMKRSIDIISNNVKDDFHPSLSSNRRWDFLRFATLEAMLFLWSLKNIASDFICCYCHSNLFSCNVAKSRVIVKSG